MAKFNIIIIMLFISYIGQAKECKKVLSSESIDAIEINFNPLHFLSNTGLLDYAKEFDGLNVFPFVGKTVSFDYKIDPLYASSPITSIALRGVENNGEGSARADVLSPEAFTDSFVDAYSKLIDRGDSVSSGELNSVKSLQEFAQILILNNNGEVINSSSIIDGDISNTNIPFYRVSLTLVKSIFCQSLLSKISQFLPFLTRNDLSRKVARVAIIHTHPGKNSPPSLGDVRYADQLKTLLPEELRDKIGIDLYAIPVGNKGDLVYRVLPST